MQAGWTPARGRSRPRRRCGGDGSLERARAERYAGWDTAEAKGMLAGTLDGAAQRVLDKNLNPQPRSGRQERLENLVNRFI